MNIWLAGETGYGLGGACGSGAGRAGSGRVLVIGYGAKHIFLSANGMQSSNSKIWGYYLGNYSECNGVLGASMDNSTKGKKR